MATNIATVTAKGQITIPKAIRQILGIQEKEQLLFLVEGERLILIPLRHHPLSELYGALPATQPYPGHQAIREEIHTELGECMKRGEE
jgi:AbrB family looped-hinge helix DNA binding protein